MSLKMVLALPAVPYADRRKLLPKQPGLYFAIRNEEVIYVGMSTKSIQSRWMGDTNVGYAIRREEITADGIRIAYLVYAETNSIKEDERAAIREFCPLLNSQHVPDSLKREQRIRAEACKWIDCDEHDHDTWPPLKPPTAIRPCECIVHVSCGEKQGAAFRDARLAIETKPTPTD